MVRNASLFSQLLQLVPRSLFASIVHKHRGEHGAKGFTCWSQFTAMLFCHLAQTGSLREICYGLACCLGKLVHLGIKRSPSKSNLSYANAHRPAEMYEEFFWGMLDHIRSLNCFGSKKHNFRFKNKLYSVDSTTISLCLSLFPWAKFRRAKGGVKAHVALDHDDYMPSFVLITSAKTHDSKILSLLEFQPESIVVLDRAYNDFTYFGLWCESKVWFVTRLKDKTVYEVVRECTPPKNRNIRSDQHIRLGGVNAQAKCPHILRRVVVWDAQHNREIILLTNHLDFGATTIADIYKERWQIELFFKALKQNLKIKSFVGTSENALRIQIWTALIAMLLLKWMHYRSKANWSFSNLVVLLRLNLFTYRDLVEWLDSPFDTPPEQAVPEQLEFGFG